MKKSIRQAIAGALLAASLVVALPAIALADDVEDDTGMDTEEVISSSNIKKTWTVTSEDQIGEGETFTFKLEYLYSEALGTNDEPSDPSLGTDADGQATIKLTSDDFENLTATGTTSLKNLVAEYDFDEVGIYYFLLSEVAGDNTNIDYDDTTYIVKVTVAWEEDYDNVEIVAIAVYTTTTDDEGNTVADEKGDANFNNGAVDASDLTLKKVVSGIGADPTEAFTFIITFSGLTGSYSTSLEDENGNTIYLEPDDEGNYSLTVTLSHGESITIYNLPEGATYTIVEASNDGYTTSATATDDGKVDADGDEDTEDFTTKEGDASYTVTGQVDSEDDTVIYTNTSTFTADTGITLNTIMFAIIAVVVVAGGVALVISRRNRHYDEF